MSSENLNNRPCSCAAMKLFSVPLNPNSLKKNAEVALSRNLPTNPNDIANQINGVPASAFKNAQVAMVGNLLIQQKLNALPEIVKSQPQVKQLDNQLKTTQTELTTKTAQVHKISTQLSAIEENKKIALSKKDRIEQNFNSSASAAGATTQNKLLAEKSRLEKDFAEKQTALIPDSKILSNQLENLPEYKNIQSQLDALNQQQASLLQQYTASKDSLELLSTQIQNTLPSVSQNLDMIQGQFGNKMSSVAGIGTSLGSEQLFTSAKDTLPPFPQMPTMPATPTMPAMPALPALPELPLSLPKDNIDWITLPPLPPTPQLPAMPAYPGLPEGLPSVSPQLLDDSITSSLESAENKILNQAHALASSEEVNFNDVAAYFPSNAQNKSTEVKSALTKTLNGYMTPALTAIPPLPARPALPEFPPTADLTELSNLKIPTLKSLKMHETAFLPAEFVFFSAIWTQITAKRAAAQRTSDAIKEQTAEFQKRIIDLIDDQKAAIADNVPLQQYLEKKSGTNPIYTALGNDQVSDFIKKFSSSPETPLQCKVNCQNEEIRQLFPDLSSPEQMKVAGMFANAKELASTPAMHVLSVGGTSADFVKSHIINLESRIKDAGGKTVMLAPEDFKNALNTSAGMINLEDKLNNISLLTLTDIKDLSSQESALMSEVCKKMSSSIPVFMTTPSIGTLSTDPVVNTAMISQLAPSGSTVDARAPTEVPQLSVYDQRSNDKTGIFSVFKKSQK